MASGSPYEALVGAAWTGLSPGVVRAHTTPLDAEGELTVIRASRGLGGLVARLIQLPAPGERVPTTLSLREKGEGVEWVRTFDGMRAVSEQRLVAGRIREAAPPFELEIALVAEGDALRHRQTGLRLFGRRAPQILGPHVAGFVTPGPDHESWHVDVRIGHPLLGKLCAYRGIMRAR